MCEFAWKPTLRLGGARVIIPESDDAGAFDVTASGMGMYCGNDRGGGLSGGSFDLMPSLTTGVIANPDFADGYGGGGFRATAAFHLFGLSVLGETGLEATNLGLRIPVAAGLGFTFASVGRFMATFDLNTLIPTWNEGDARISVGGGLRYTFTEF